ncbi:MAG: hypothetical protein GEU87_06105 [Alphaproteobacteria bacterium]|nr:hypothetical protein [Alphaproteobacteria bacterium]
MRLNRKALMGTVAAVALCGFAIGASTEAQAFDRVNWTWDLDIDENISKTVDIDIIIDPIGMINDEIMQIQIGDIKAVSRVSGVYNWKPLEPVEIKTGVSADHNLTVDAGYHYKNGGFGKASASNSYNNTQTDSFRATLDGGLTTDGNGVPFFIGGVGAGEASATLVPPSLNANADAVFGFIGAFATDGEAGFNADLGGSLRTTHAGSNSWESQYAYFNAGFGQFDGHLKVHTDEIYTIYALAPKLQDATKELPKVESLATAIGNVISIETDVAVQEHSLQVVADTNCKGVQDGDGSSYKCNPDFGNAQFDLDADLDVNDRFVGVDSGNAFHDVALLTTFAAGAGLLKKADITAVSSVDDILNASVESTATAIGNLKSIDLTTSNPENGLVIADITQVSVADVSAYSTIGGGLYAQPVSLLETGYSYGGGINLVNYNHLGGLTIAKSTATAIGNVVNIGVNSGQSATSAP